MKNRWTEKKRRPAAKAIPLFLLGLWLAVLAVFPACTFNRHRVDRAIAVDPQTGALLPDPALRVGRLDNGLGYVLLKNSRPEDRVDMHLVIEAGSFHETDDQQGLAHYLEHMLFNGTTHFPPGELIKYFQSIGMGFGNDVNARTGFFRTVYDLHLPSGDRDSLRRGLRVMADYAAGALLLPAEVDKERGIILAEKRSRDSVDYRTFTATLDFELPGSRLPRRYPIGIEAVIQSAGQEQLKAFYDAWYRPERMTLVAVGDFDPDAAAALIAEALAGLQARAADRPDPEVGATAHQGTTVLYHHEKEAGATEVTVETLVQTPPPADSPDEKKRRFIRDLAYRILNYRLDALAESSDPPFTSAQSSAGRALEYYPYAAVSATAVPEKWDRALAAVERELRAVLRYGFTRSETEQVRREVLAELDRAVAQAATRESGGLAGQIMMHLAADRVFQSPEQNRALLAPVAEALTPEILHRAFEETWAPEPRLILVTGNAVIGGPDKPEAAIRSVWEKSRETAVERTAEKDIRPFPYLPEPKTAGRVVRKVEDADIGVIRMDFENQVRLNMKPTDFKANQVTAEIRFGRGESAEPADQPALCELGEAVLNESGFGAMKKEELRLALAGKKASAVFSVAEDRFSLSGGCASDEIRLLFQLFYAFYHDWTCREEAYRLCLERFRQEYDELGHTISGAMTLAGDRFLAGGDSRFGWPADFRAFEDVGPADIHRWIDDALKQSPPEISVVGDFDPREAEAAAADYFGTIQPAADRPGDQSSRPDPLVPAGESILLRVPTEIPQAYVAVAWPTDDFWDVRRTRRLLLLSRVFSDRMRRTIREEAGQSYSQYAYHEASLAYPGYGLFHAAAEVDPEEAEIVIAAIKAMAADLAKNGVTDEEVERAREPILTGIGEMVRTNDYWLRSVLSGCREHPQRLEWSRHLAEDYRSMTAGDLTRLARQYLDNTRSVTITIRPEEAFLP